MLVDTHNGKFVCFHTCMHRSVMSCPSALLPLSLTAADCNTKGAPYEMIALSSGKGGTDGVYDVALVRWMIPSTPVTPVPVRCSHHFGNTLCVCMVLYGTA